jgi:hypothetical protein
VVLSGSRPLGGYGKTLKSLSLSNSCRSLSPIRPTKWKVGALVTQPKIGGMTILS